LADFKSAMTSRVLDAYFDASGKTSSKGDKLITLNGCLSTPEKWREFDIAWQTALQSFGFAPDPPTGRYVFHTTDFHSGYFKLKPDGLSKANERSIYRDLVMIVRAHSLFLVGFAISLKDYRKFANEYPSITKFCFGKPGTFVSVLASGKCMDWAGAKGYSKSISMTFDRGDEFWGEMYNGFCAYIRTPANEHLTTENLREGNKADFSPLQAADIVAWEARQYFSRLVDLKILVSGHRTRYEFEMLKRPSSFFTLFEYADLKRRVNEVFPDANGDIVGIENSLRQAAEERQHKLIMRRQRRNESKQNENPIE